MTFFTNEASEIKSSVEVLNDAAGFIRSLLAKKLRARIMPHLRFVYDKSMAEGVRMGTLVDQAIASDKHHDENEASTDTKAIDESNEDS